RWYNPGQGWSACHLTQLKMQAMLRNWATFSTSNFAIIGGSLWRFFRPVQSHDKEFSMKRRQFIAGAAGGAAAAASTVYSPLTIAKNTKFKLGMVTSWPTSLDTLFGTAQYIGKALESATDGDVQVEVFPAGAQVGGLEVYDTVAAGAFALGH